MKALPKFLFKLFFTDKVQVIEAGDCVQIKPVKETIEDTSLCNLVGMFAGNPMDLMMSEKLTLESYIKNT